MSNNNVLALNINSEAFNAMKIDFNKILRNTLTNMEQKESNTAELTLKLKISLFKEDVSDLETVAYQTTREVIKPVFVHKVSSVMQIKDEESGILSGDYELVWDKELGDYVMRPIKSPQQSLFDSDNYTDVSDIEQYPYSEI